MDLDQIFDIHILDEDNQYLEIVDAVRNGEILIDGVACKDQLVKYILLALCKLGHRYLTSPLKIKCLLYSLWSQLRYRICQTNGRTSSNSTSNMIELIYCSILKNNIEHSWVRKTIEFIEHTSKTIEPLIAYQFNNIDQLLYDITDSNHEKVLSLLNQVINVNLPNLNGWSLLHYCASLANVTKSILYVVVTLIEKGIDINAVDNSNNTPLHTAALCLNYSLLDYLVKVPNISKSSLNNVNRTPLDILLSRLSNGRWVKYMTSEQLLEIIRQLLPSNDPHYLWKKWSYPLANESNTEKKYFFCHRDLYGMYYIINYSSQLVASNVLEIAKPIISSKEQFYQLRELFLDCIKRKKNNLLVKLLDNIVYSPLFTNQYPDELSLIEIEREYLIFFNLSLSMAIVTNNAPAIEFCFDRLLPRCTFHLLNSELTFTTFDEFIQYGSFIYFALIKLNIKTFELIFTNYPQQYLVLILLREKTFSESDAVQSTLNLSLFSLLGFQSKEESYQFIQFPLLTSASILGHGSFVDMILKKTYLLTKDDDSITHEMNTRLENIYRQSLYFSLTLSKYDVCETIKASLGLDLLSKICLQSSEQQTSVFTLFFQLVLQHFFQHHMKYLLQSSTKKKKGYVHHLVYYEWIRPSLFYLVPRDNDLNILRSFFQALPKNSNQKLPWKMQTTTSINPCTHLPLFDLSQHLRKQIYDYLGLSDMIEHIQTNRSMQYLDISQIFQAIENAHPESYQIVKERYQQQYFRYRKLSTMLTHTKIKIGLRKLSTVTPDSSMLKFAYRFILIYETFFQSSKQRSQHLLPSSQLDSIEHAANEENWLKFKKILTNILKNEQHYIDFKAFLHNLLNSSLLLQSNPKALSLKNHNDNPWILLEGSNWTELQSRFEDSGLSVSLKFTKINPRKDFDDVLHELHAYSLHHLKEDPILQSTIETLTVWMQHIIADGKIYFQDDYSLYHLENDCLRLYPNIKSSISHRTLLTLLSLQDQFNHLSYFQSISNMFSSSTSSTRPFTLLSLLFPSSLSNSFAKDNSLFNQYFDQLIKYLEYLKFSFFVEPTFTQNSSSTISIFSSTLFQQNCWEKFQSRQQYEELACLLIEYNSFLGYSDRALISYLLPLTALGCFKAASMILTRIQEGTIQYPVTKIFWEDLQFTTTKGNQETWRKKLQEYTLKIWENSFQSEEPLNKTPTSSILSFELIQITPLHFALQSKEYEFIDLFFKLFPQFPWYYEQISSMMNEFEDYISWSIFISSLTNYRGDHWVGFRYNFELLPMDSLYPRSLSRGLSQDQRYAFQFWLKCNLYFNQMMSYPGETYIFPASMVMKGLSLTTSLSCFITIDPEDGEEDNAKSNYDPTLPLVKMMDGTELTFDNVIINPYNLMRAMPLPCHAIGFENRGISILQFAIQAKDYEFVKYLFNLNSLWLHRFFALNEYGESCYLLLLYQQQFEFCSEILSKWFEMHQISSKTVNEMDFYQYNTLLLPSIGYHLELMSANHFQKQMLLIQPEVQLNFTIPSINYFHSLFEIIRSNHLLITSIETNQQFSLALLQLVLKYTQYLWKIICQRNFYSFLQFSSPISSTGLASINVSSDLSSPGSTSYMYNKLDSFVRARQILSILNIPYSCLQYKPPSTQSNQTTTSKPKDFEIRSQDLLPKLFEFNPYFIYYHINSSIYTQLQYLLSGWFRLRLEKLKTSQSPQTSPSKSPKKRNLRSSMQVEDNLILFHSPLMSCVELGNRLFQPSSSSLSNNLINILSIEMSSNVENIYDNRMKYAPNPLIPQSSSSSQSSAQFIEALLRHNNKQEPYELSEALNSAYLILEFGRYLCFSRILSIATHQPSASKAQNIRKPFSSTSNAISSSPLENLYYHERVEKTSNLLSYKLHHLTSQDYLILKSEEKCKQIDFMLQNKLSMSMNNYIGNQMIQNLQFLLKGKSQGKETTPIQLSYYKYPESYINSLKIASTSSLFTGKNSDSISDPKHMSLILNRSLGMNDRIRLCDSITMDDLKLFLKLNSAYSQRLNVFRDFICQSLSSLLLDIKEFSGSEFISRFVLMSSNVFPLQDQNLFVGNQHLSNYLQRQDLGELRHNVLQEKKSSSNLLNTKENNNDINKKNVNNYPEDNPNKNTLKKDELIILQDIINILQSFTISQFYFPIQYTTPSTTSNKLKQKTKLYLTKFVKMFGNLVVEPEDLLSVNQMVKQLKAGEVLKISPEEEHNIIMLFHAVNPSSSTDLNYPTNADPTRSILALKSSARKDELILEAISSLEKSLEVCSVLYWTFSSLFSLSTSVSSSSSPIGTASVAATNNTNAFSRRKLDLQDYQITKLVPNLENNNYNSTQLTTGKENSTLSTIKRLPNYFEYDIRRYLYYFDQSLPLHPIFSLVSPLQLKGFLQFNKNISHPSSHQPLHSAHQLLSTSLHQLMHQQHLKKETSRSLCLKYIVHMIEAKSYTYSIRKYPALQILWLFLIQASLAGDALLVETLFSESNELKIGFPSELIDEFLAIYSINMKYFLWYVLLVMPSLACINNNPHCNYERCVQLLFEANCPLESPYPSYISVIDLAMMKSISVDLIHVILTRILILQKNNSDQNKPKIPKESETSSQPELSLSKSLLAKVESKVIAPEVKITTDSPQEPRHIIATILSSVIQTQCQFNKNLSAYSTLFQRLMTINSINIQKAQFRLARYFFFDKSFLSILPKDIDNFLQKVSLSIGYLTNFQDTRSYLFTIFENTFETFLFPSFKHTLASKKHKPTIICPIQRDIHQTKELFQEYSKNTSKHLELQKTLDYSINSYNALTLTLLDLNSINNFSSMFDIFFPTKIRLELLELYLTKVSSGEIQEEGSFEQQFTDSQAIYWNSLHDLFYLIIFYQRLDILQLFHNNLTNFELSSLQDQITFTPLFFPNSTYGDSSQSLNESMKLSESSQTVDYLWNKLLMDCSSTSSDVNEPSLFDFLAKHSSSNISLDILDYLIQNGLVVSIEFIAESLIHGRYHESFLLKLIQGLVSCDEREDSNYYRDQLIAYQLNENEETFLHVLTRRQFSTIVSYWLEKISLIPSNEIMQEDKLGLTPLGCSIGVGCSSITKLFKPHCPSYIHEAIAVMTYALRKLLMVRPYSRPKQKKVLLYSL